MANGKKTTVTRELVTEHLTPEEHADLVATQMNLRGGTTQISGAVLKLKGLMMRPNALLNADRIDAALREVETLAKAGRAELAKLRVA